MIVYGLMLLIYKILDILLIFEIPSYSEQLDAAYQVITSAMTYAKSLINLFVPWDFVVVLLPITVAIMSADHIYHFVMWVIRKIPMAGMS